MWSNKKLKRSGTVRIDSMKPVRAQRKANVYQYGFEVNFEWSDWACNLTNYDVYKHLNKA